MSEALCQSTETCRALSEFSDEFAPNNPWQFSLLTSMPMINEIRA